MRKSLTLAAVAAGVLALGACDTADNVTFEREVPYSMPGSIPDAVDPYNSNGIWTVPQDVVPGRYRVTENTEPVTSLRWMQLCADPYCEQPTGGSTEDMAYGHENRFIVIPDDGSVQAYRNNGVKLTLVEEQPTGEIDCETASMAEWTEHCDN